MFNYKESNSGYDMLTLKTDQHVEVEYLFDNGDATHVYLDGDEFPLTSDTLHGVFVVVKGEFISLIALGHKASEDYPQIMKEIAQEAREDEAMARELSSPYLTGRI